MSTTTTSTDRYSYTRGGVPVPIWITLYLDPNRYDTPNSKDRVNAWVEAARGRVDPDYVTVGRIHAAGGTVRIHGTSIGVEVIETETGRAVTDPTVLGSIVLAMRGAPQRWDVFA